MKKLIFFIILGFLLVINFGESQVFWNLAWKYRTCMQISEVAGYNLTNYVVKTTLDTKTLIDAGKMNKDCSDLRVVVNNISLPYYFIECNKENTTVFFPVNLTPYEKKIVCIYYGNPQAYDEKNIKIFSWYDNFENQTLFAERNWTLYRCDRSTDLSYDFAWSLKCSSTPTKLAYALVNVTGNEFYFAINGEENVNFYINDTLIYQNIPPKVWTVYSSNFTPSVFNWTSTKAGNWWLDTVFSRQKVEPEPVITVKPEVVYGKQITYLKNYCENDYKIAEETVCTVDEILSCTTNQTLTYCDYGCWEGKCNPSPYMRIAFVAGIMIVFLFVATAIWKFLSWR